MTYNPDDLLAVRGYLLAELDLLPGVARGVDLEPGEVGIAGDPAHASSGGYHEGNDDLARVGLLTADYSKRESARDRPGSNAASALDIGEFDATVAARRITLRSLTLSLVDACRRGDPRTRDIREVIYTPDGATVARWDRLGVRAGGDSSHLWHTHISFFRDSEGRRHLDDNVLGLLKEFLDGSAPSPSTGIAEREASMIQVSNGAKVQTVVLTDLTTFCNQRLSWDYLESLRQQGMPRYLISQSQMNEVLALPERPVDVVAGEVADLVAKVDGIQASGQPNQTQVDAAILKALQDPSVINALGAAVASHIHVS